MYGVEKGTARQAQGRLKSNQLLALAGLLVQGAICTPVQVPWGQGLVGDAEDLDFGLRSVGSLWLGQVVVGADSGFLEDGLAAAWDAGTVEWCRWRGRWLKPGRNSGVEGAVS